MGQSGLATRSDLPYGDTNDNVALRLPSENGTLQSASGSRRQRHNSILAIIIIILYGNCDTERRVRFAAPERLGKPATPQTECGNSDVLEMLTHCYPKESSPAFSLQLQAREKSICNAALSRESGPLRQTATPLALALSGANPHGSARNGSVTAG